MKRRHTRITTRRTLKQAFGNKRLGIPRQLPIAVLTSRERAWVLEMIDMMMGSYLSLECKHKTPCFRRECIYLDISTNDLRLMEALYKRLTNGKTTC